MKKFKLEKPKFVWISENKMTQYEKHIYPNHIKYGGFYLAVFKNLHLSFMCSI